MMKLLSGLDFKKFKKIDFIVAETDEMSIQKIESLSSQISITYSTNKIKRSRKVGQSYLTSVFTTLLAIFYSIPLMFKIKPDLLLVNGPGTCVPCCFIVFILSRFLYLIPKTKIVYVESICRVQKLSLTGRILYHLRIADSIIVQWPELQKKYPRCTYLGRLV